MDAHITYHKNLFWNALENVRHGLAVLFFFFMPFTQALTVNLGFPLKVSEVVLIMLGGIYLLFKTQVKLPPFIIYTLSALFTIVLLSVIINIYWDYPYNLRVFESRFGYIGDTLTRLGYFILALLAFFITVDLLLTNKTRYLRIWLYGAIASSIYSWYLVSFSFLHQPVYLLPGMQNPPQTIGPGIIRSGTFLEGNYMGLYMLLSGIIAFYIRKFRTGTFLFLTTIITFSTLSIISVLLFLAFYFRQYIFRRKYVAPSLILFVLSIPLLIYLYQTPFVKTYIDEKIFSDISKVNSNVVYSKADRVVTMQTAINTALGNPFFGVGLSNFSLHYDRYYQRGVLDEKMYNIFRRKNQKVIPNNIYVEIWAEAGSIALFLFIVFMIMILFCARTDVSQTLFPAVLCMILCFNAYPSFIMIYLWSFMAIPVVHFIQTREHATSHLSK